MTVSRSPQQTAQEHNSTEALNRQHNSEQKFRQLFFRSWKPQNSEISAVFEGSEAGIVKFLWNLKFWEFVLRGEESIPRAEQLPGRAQI